MRRGLSTERRARSRLMWQSSTIKTILVEVASHVKKSDVAVLRRKAELFVRKSGRRVDRLLMVTPYADEEAFKMATALGVEIYTKV
jgi:hypothetical protein